MLIQYKKLHAEVTPEALARLKKHKIILESSEQSKLKGRYSMVIFDTYGSITLDDETLTIEKNEKQIVENDQPYDKLKQFIDRYKVNIQEESLADLPFISGFVGTCSFDLVRHEFPKLKQHPL